MLREQPPGLVLMASRIGPLSPMQLTRVIRADEVLAEVKIVVYAADGDDPLGSELVAAGAHSFLVLPLSPEKLIREVVLLIGRP